MSACADVIAFRCVLFTVAIFCVFVSPSKIKILPTAEHFYLSGSWLKKNQSMAALYSQQRWFNFITDYNWYNWFSQRHRFLLLILPKDFDLCEGRAEVSSSQSFNQRLDRRLGVGLDIVWHAHILLTIISCFCCTQAALQDTEFFWHVGYLGNRHKNQTYHSINASLKQK